MRIFTYLPALAACALLWPSVTAYAGQDTFEADVNSFFAESLSDSEALAKAESIQNDTDEIGTVFGASTQKEVTSVLTDYENEKYAYLMDGTEPSQYSAFLSEWQAQKEYIAEGLPDGASVDTLVPRWCVTACQTGPDGQMQIYVQEWDTESYTASGHAGNTTACMYEYYMYLTDTGDSYTITKADGQYFRSYEDSDDGGTLGHVSGGVLVGGSDGLVGAAQVTYNPAAAIAYADRWAMSANTGSYVFHNGVDCANFVSQCLFAGGLPQSSTWKPESVAWVNCQAQQSYFGSLYSAPVTASASTVKIGNPVYYDWTGDGHYDHTAICVGTDAAGNPIVDAHTNARYHVSWDMKASARTTSETIDIAGALGGNSAPSVTPTPNPSMPSSNGQTTLNGTDYAPVYDFSYYINTYPDLKAAYGNNPAGALLHFVTYGMKEGRQGSSSFSVQVYKENYADLRAAFGNNLASYYLHYIQYGKREGRNATSEIESKAETTLNGIDYSAVYDFNYYISKYPDIKAAYGNNPAGALRHFVTYGMDEGRQGSASFYVWYYRGNYADLIMAYGDDLKPYYLHYVRFGQKEGRVATRKIPTNVMFYDGVDYANVYDFCYYTKRYPDIMAAFGHDPAGAIRHFIQYGIKEGRQAESSFNVISYQNNYPDLRAAFGTDSSDLVKYVMHYLKFGKSEGRSGL